MIPPSSPRVPLDPGPPCPWCGSRRGSVAVHGHRQCSRCGSNLEPCCGGAAGDEVEDAPRPEPRELSPPVLALAFTALGGDGATVTGESLRNRLVASLDCDLEEADAMLAIAVRAGSLHRLAGDLFRLLPAPGSP